MTSSYTEKLTKVKNALEHVFVKKTDIKNNLTSTDTDKPLSANQGKVLNDGKVDKISGKGLSKNDFTDTYKDKLDDLDSNLSNKANSTHTHGNLQNDGSVGISDNVNKNVITDGNGKITTEDKPTIPSDVSQLTDSNNTTFTPKSHTHGNLQNNGQIIVSGNIQSYKNVITTANGYISTEAKPSIPSSSSTIPSADTQNGSYGSGTDYARANHTHPKSSLYAESSHTHTIGDIGVTSEILGVNLWDDDGSYVYMLGNYLIYDINDTDAIYYKDATDLNNEIATKGDIANAVGDAITYINQ
ncbi:MAG: hypothetical protein IKF82_00095 [Bacilli bacterium]|nr:hypothetical protein [Bacilli bacterium]